MHTGCVNVKSSQVTGSVRCLMTAALLKDVHGKEGLIVRKFSLFLFPVTHELFSQALLSRN